jgi:hypothetical protein
LGSYLPAHQNRCAGDAFDFPRILRQPAATALAPFQTSISFTAGLQGKTRSVTLEEASQVLVFCTNKPIA